jgi:hypothetical protein
MYMFSNGDVRYGTFEQAQWQGKALHVHQDGRHEIQTWGSGLNGASSYSQLRCLSMPRLHTF